MRLNIALCGLTVFAIGAADVCEADFAHYRLPGSTLSIRLEGKVTFNPGGTVTLRHPRGTLYFSNDDLDVIRTPDRRAVYGKSRAKASGDIESKLELAKTALKLGMLKECKGLLAEAWRMDPTNEKIAKLAALMRAINRTVPENAASEESARSLVGGSKMKFLRSKHFLLLHDTDEKPDPVTRKSRAQMRLDLLETVYESYFLSFGLRGFYLRPPAEPMNVVLFSEHKDFMQLEKRLGMALRQTAGFYLPKENIAIFFDSGTTEIYKLLGKLTDELERQKVEAKRSRSSNAKNIIRLANTISLLLDIQRESEDVTVVSHEATHQLAANTKLFPRDGPFIRWVHEGLASYFESSKMGSWSGVGAVDKDRIGYYRALEGDPVRGGIEFIVSDLGFLVEAALGDQRPAYGQAWALTHFMYNERFDQMIKFYGAIRKIDKDLEPKAKGLKLMEIFGQSFGDKAKFEIEWRRYMRTLKTDIEIMAGSGR